jgi:hypothetical protein
MPARDILHDTVRRALQKEGWTITHDPFPIKIGDRDLSIDLGAEQLLAAHRGTVHIAVEVKSFVGSSEIRDLRDALGQYILYLDLLAVIAPERDLFLAIRHEVYLSLFQEPVGTILLANNRVQLVVFNPTSEEIVTWLPHRPTAP